MEFTLKGKAALQTGESSQETPALPAKEWREGCGWEGVLFTGRSQRPQECTGSHRLPGTRAPPGTPSP